jgi:hypothetical protein
MFYYIINFIILLILLYVLYLYIPILFPNKLNRIEPLDNGSSGNGSSGNGSSGNGSSGNGSSGNGLFGGSSSGNGLFGGSSSGNGLFGGNLFGNGSSSNGSSDASGTVQDASGTVQDASAIVVPGEDILNNLKLRAQKDNLPTALSYINDYLNINNAYKQNLIDKQAEEATKKYQSDEKYEPTFPNKLICKIANSGLPFMGWFAKFCTILPDSTKCHGWSDNFDGWCQKDIGGGVEFGLGKPSQLVSGQKSKYAGGCPGGAFGAGGQGRAECEYRYAGNSKLPLNSTQCYLTAGGDFDKACREQAGFGHDYADGVSSDYIFGVKNFLPDGKMGCWAGQRRAECGLGYANGEKLQPTSTKCFLWTAGFNGACKDAGRKADGTSNLILDTRESTLTELKKNDPGADYGKYRGGCILGQGRGACVDVSDIKVGDKFVGEKCGAWNYISDGWCHNDYGDDFFMSNTFDSSDIGKKQYDCLKGFGRATCVKTEIAYTGDPKNPSKGDNNCTNEYWGWTGSAACTDWFSKHSPNARYAKYAGEAVDCGAGKSRDKWYTAKYKCHVWPK